nr:probable glutathione S-transferase [Ipomoea batatas]
MKNGSFISFDCIKDCLELCDHLVARRPVIQNCRMIVEVLDPLRQNRKFLGVDQFQAGYLFEHARQVSQPPQYDVEESDVVSPEKFLAAQLFFDEFKVVQRLNNTFFLFLPFHEDLNRVSKIDLQPGLATASEPHLRINFAVHWPNDSSVSTRLDHNQLNGKKFFGGYIIGFLDIVLGWLANLPSMFEEITDLKLIDAEKFPVLSEWMQNFYNHPAILGHWPPRDKMITKFQAILNAIEAK